MVQTIVSVVAVSSAWDNVVVVVAHSETILTNEIRLVEHAHDADVSKRI